MNADVAALITCTQPAWLAARARLYGRHATNPARARVLEVREAKHCRELWAVPVKLNAARRKLR